jgi:uncharacterized iron-regulated protein
VKDYTDADIRHTMLLLNEFLAEHKVNHIMAIEVLAQSACMLVEKYMTDYGQKIFYEKMVEKLKPYQKEETHESRT